MLDIELIRRRRTELGISARTLASLVGVSSTVVIGLEHGRNHPELPLALVSRLANALGIEASSLFAHPGAPGDAPATDVDDAATLGALLHQQGVLVHTSALLDALGWKISRLRSALDALDQQLRPCGLLVHRLPGRVGIRAAVEPVSRDEVRRLHRLHLARSGMNLTEARMLRRVMEGRTPREPSNAESVALAVLVNAELIVTQPATKKSAMPSWTISDDVAYSLMLTDTAG